MKSLNLTILLLISINALAQTTYPTGVTGCIARWDFSSIDGVVDSLSDVSGNGHNGTVSSLTAANGFRNIPGTAMHFDGSSSFAQVPQNSQLNAQHITIIALVKLDTFYTGLCQDSRIIIKGPDDGIAGNYQMGIGDNTFDGSCSVYSPDNQQLAGGFGTASYTESPGHYIQLHQWYLFVESYDGNTLKKYQVVMDTSTYITSISPFYTTSGLATPLDSNTSDIIIGHTLNPTFPYWFHGTMDELVLFNKVLSDSEIESVYTYLWGLPASDSPSFANGVAQDISVCQNGHISIDSALAVIDTVPGHPETWGLVTPPSHGTASVAYSMASTGGTLVPSGLTYTPYAGYSGSDAFEVSISNGVNTNHTTLTVTVDPFPNAGAISGADSVCPGDTVNFSETVPGGIWATSDGSIAIIDGSGMATGVSPGMDTVVYVVMNSCGIVSTILPFTVNSYLDCHTAVPVVHSDEGIKVYPNPNSGTFTITISSKVEEETRLIVTNVLGEKIKELTITSNKPTDVTLNAAPGIYFLDASGADINSVTRLVISK